MNPPTLSPKVKSGSGCLTLFALPFAAVGVGTGYLCIKQLIEGPEDLEKTILLGIFALVFGGAGFGLIFAARWGKGKLREQEQLKQNHPDSPWMWKPEWASGRIKGSSQTAMWFSWVFAIFWNLISAPMLFFLPHEIEKGNHAAAIGLLFPVVGVGLLFWAVQTTRRYRRFGVSFLEVDTLPGVIGGKLCGTIHSGLQEKPPEGIKVSLHCVRRRESRGKNSSASERLVWEESYVLGAERLYRGREGLDLPVDFHIPYESEPSDESDRYNKIIWRVEASAKLTGVDYETRFDVPVFKTADSSTDVPKESGYGFETAPSQEFDPKTATIEIRPSALGGTEYYFAAARNKGAAAALTIFFLLFSGITAALFYFGVPLLFPIVFAFFCVLMLVFVVDVLFTSMRVVIEDGKVRVVRSTFGLRSAKEIPYSDVSDIKLKIGMQQQQTMTQTAKAYYDIEIHRQSGRKVAVGRSIPSKREAEWLAEQMLLQIARG
jgi:hypothetical protein